MKNKYFVKYMRNPSLIDIGKIRPTAVILLLQVINRAKNTESGNPDLNIGEAFIGDFESYGVTRQTYRSDKKLLEKWQILTYRVTNKGTIARLTNQDYFDINWKKITNNITNEPTRHQPTTNHQATTNIEIKDKKINNIFLSRYDIWEIANKYGVDVSDVLKTYNDVIDNENRKKYAIKNSKKTLDSWIKRAIGNNSIQSTSEFASLEILKDQEPKGDKANLLVIPK